MTRTATTKTRKKTNRDDDGEQVSDQEELTQRPVVRDDSNSDNENDNEEEDEQRKTRSDLEASHKPQQRAMNFLCCIIRFLVR